MARTSRKNLAPGRADAHTQVVYSAGGYARLSVEDERHRDRHTLENQADMIRAFIAGQTDIRLNGLYQDDGESGTSLDRPGFQKLMEDVRAGKINCIVVKDLSRLARNFREAGRYLEQIFPFLGVRFVAIDDGLDTAHPNPGHDGIAVPGTNLVNEMYARDISQKVNSSLARKRERGEFLGSKAPYGYRKSEEDKHRLAPDEPAASVVRDVFRWMLEGWSDARIVRQLNERGVAPPGRYHYERGDAACKKYRDCEYWHRSAVKKIAGNRAYVGDTVQGKTNRSCFGARSGTRPEAEWVVVENTHEPLVDRDTFHAVQELLEARRRKQLNQDARGLEGQKKNRPFKKIRCGDCGRAMERYWFPLAGGVRRYGYRCRCRTEIPQNACAPKTIPEPELVKAVFATVQIQIALAAEFRQAAGQVLRREKDHPGCRAIEKETKRLRQKISRNATVKCSLYESYMESLLSKREYLLAKERYDRENDDMEGQLVKALGEKRFWSECPFAQDLGQMKDGMEAVFPEERLVDLVQGIAVFAGRRVEITLNITDEIRLFAQSPAIGRVAAHE